MLPRVVYVLADDELGPYADMAFVSASAVRALHPELERCLVTDRATEARLGVGDRALLDLFHTVHVVPDVAGSAKERSRELKTRLRQELSGEFLYLDVDTVPIRPFTDITRFQGDILAAHDRIAQRPEPHIPHWWEPLYRQLGWAYPPVRYLNNGVAYFRDTPAVHELSREWHRRWRASTAAGCANDQPAFNAAAHELGIEVGILPVPYNAMVTVAPRFARGARILHFYASELRSRERAVTLLEYLVAHRRATGTVDFAAIARARRRNYPWMVTEGIRRNWETGHYLNAAYLAAKRGVRAAREWATHFRAKDLDERTSTLPPIP
ncbi:MAG TPA: putative nucleotide-diphospho-sugar transferase [Gemmatimonadales bacterium]|nr:putative nucleotide-diphospho-sugar transferase [Gemmatimonadales bacterium]